MIELPCQRANATFDVDQHEGALLDSRAIQLVCLMEVGAVKFWQQQ